MLIYIIVISSSTYCTLCTNLSSWLCAHATVPYEHKYTDVDIVHARHTAWTAQCRANKISRTSCLHSGETVVYFLARATVYNAASWVYVVHQWNRTSMDARLRGKGGGLSARRVRSMTAQFSTFAIVSPRNGKWWNPFRKSVGRRKTRRKREGETPLPSTAKFPARDRNALNPLLLDAPFAEAPPVAL